jgi:hypothetical protein
MNFPEKKDYSAFGSDISFKIKPYLTFAEMQSIIIGCINVYDNGAHDMNDEILTDEIPNWNKNILFMEKNFNQALVELCTDLEDFDYDVLVAYDIITELKEVIVNAESTLQKIYDIIEKRDNIESAIGRGFENLITKIPTPKELQSLYGSVKKDILSGKFTQLTDRVKDVLDIGKNLKGE